VESRRAVTDAEKGPAGHAPSTYIPQSEKHPLEAIDLKPSTHILNYQTSTLKHQTSTINTQHSTLNTQHSTVKNQSSTVIAESEIIYLQPSTLNPEQPLF
jgi:hypothetical protein